MGKAQMGREKCMQNLVGKAQSSQLDNIKIGVKYCWILALKLFSRRSERVIGYKR
jgi:hypothetical protein